MDGILRTATGTPKLRVADVQYNCAEMIKMIKEAAEKEADLIVFPELAVTGYTCGDLFFQSSLIRQAKEALFAIARETRGRSITVAAGCPVGVSGKLYNTAVFIRGGKILGIVPKRNLPDYGEFYETRWFTRGEREVIMISLKDTVTGEIYEVPFGMNVMLRDRKNENVCIAAEICEDAWVADTPSTSHALAGASVIVNCSASDEVVGKVQYRRMLIAMTSARLAAAYVYANAGEGESTQDLVFGGQSLICENGVILAENPLYQNAVQYADIDCERICHERVRMNTFSADSSGIQNKEKYHIVETSLISAKKEEYMRAVDPYPFVPTDQKKKAERCEEILNMQARGLKKRLMHIGCTHVVLGISGGLDSTLALLAAVRAFDLLDIPRKNILSVTMPAFGTTGRTYRNAVRLAQYTGSKLLEIPIEKAVMQHFSDISHDPDNHNVVYENSQARERTQVLMDLANQYSALVIGTGDMSELALGWATYNGDHMSMYAVNAGVPKTLVRHLIGYYAESAADQKLSEVLTDILDTPVSPELLPPENGDISQKTEDLVGPYELHDFFLFQVLRYGYGPKKIFQLAKYAFGPEPYDSAVILKWLEMFYRRFFSQQFKRSCLPDGPKIGSVAVSPRGDLRMPSDAAVSLWLRELEEISKDK